MQGRVNKSGLVHFLLGLVSSRATGQLIGLIAVLSIIWFAGRIVGLDTTDKKLIAMAAVTAVFIVFIFIRWLWTKRSGDKLASELASHNAGSSAELDEIKEKMQEALSSLKASHLGAGYRGNTALYALPWYMIIGPSATGKSTLFANSGLHFPYSNSNELHIQGFGGTRNCDWWFSDQAILIDTAGRYTTEQSENKEWLSFLSLLKKYRPKLPINGVMVAISVADVLTSDSEEIRQHVKLVRERIEELITQLGVIFPVYITFTKTDLISGFEPFFNDLTEKEREQVFGAYLLDISEDQQNDPAEMFEVRMEELYQRLCEQRLSKVARERNEHRKQLILDFPNQFKSASTKLTEFVNLLFKANPYQEVPWFAGVYFTSGTQEGTPIERITNGVRDQFGAVVVEQKQESITQSYFINRVFNDVIFKLQDLTRGNRKKRLVGRWLKGLTVTSGLASIAAVTALLITSYTSNQLLLNQGEARVKAIVEANVNKAKDEQKLAATLDLFEHYQSLNNYEKQLPWYFIFGIYEGDETLTSVSQVLFNQLNQLITLPAEKQTLAQLKEFEAIWSADDADARAASRQAYYDALKLHLMLSAHPEHKDNEFAKQQLLSFISQHFNIEIDAQADSPITSQLNDLVDLYLANISTDLENPGEILFWQNNETAVLNARNSLNTQPEAEPLYQQIISSFAERKKAIQLKQFMAAKNRDVLKSNFSIPYVYTNAGWQEYVYPEIKRISRLVFSGDWVMGTSNESGQNAVDEAQADALAKAMRSYYFTDYGNTWFAFLNSIKVPTFRDLNDASINFARLSSTDGPLIDLMTLVNDNIVVADKPSAVSANNDKIATILSGATDTAAKKVAKGKLAKQVAERPDFSQVSTVRAPELETRFADLRRFSQHDEDKQMSDYMSQYISSLSSIHSDIKAMAASNEDDAQAMVFVQDLLSGNSQDNALQSSWIIIESQTRALDPETKDTLDVLFKAPLQSGIASIMAKARSQLNEEWENQVYTMYSNSIAGKYPFNLTGPDAAIADVSEFLNSETGVLWNFINSQLKPFMKVRRGVWEEKQWNGVGIGFNQELLDGLTKANKVTRSLFLNGSDAAGFNFQMMPVPQKGIRETYLGFSEQGYRYRNEPEEWRNFSWPGRGAAEKAILYGLDNAGRRVTIEQDGPWALLKVLNEANVKWIKGTEFLATWELVDKSEQSLTVQFSLKSGRNSGIFSKYMLTSFALPNSLFAPKPQLAQASRASVQ
ncbi:type VI secretion system membrane subunit TssM [Pseudoalteromonas shioyasakiensis]|uniref:Type VI secretion system membrane subunit TssM n=1 Tax=Pseudoalteromonas shioyasakiensis TaxID=1190813 RepID=A0ABT6TYW2_9GAMM|nr:MULTISPECIES: type VI secretion system membrane subunit TssM [Pseudoalteromonas]MDI4668980.1 type VI secretion system membrane subunit TssM [Pseudoalteromonas shioyasakiensis]MDI4674105.1 type VI secretion system membrane subunit TssM [Pseudoalteromonas shioyasakiensis]MDI4685346.1 type VI secretion system membrane subunit TssM [Pseudoalteromonas shioyasakiensis]MDI4704182.1 type VI secretion system membrane subunit TssM [Pseudoalteromonas shioyasakiensis]NUJ21226.1 type VI secretion system